MAHQAKIRVENLNFYFGALQSLKNINLEAQSNQILAIFGPARGGKTTLLRALNRLNDLVHDAHHTGRVLLDGQDVYDPRVDVAELRRKVGMVFALPVSLPTSVFENVAYGPRLKGIKDHAHLEETVYKALTAAVLWEEVKDRLHTPALRLSGGQQQRLSIARVLALEPEVILLDEPSSGLDPISTLKIEESLQKLKRDYTIIIAPHSVQQAARIADQAAFFLMGELIEYGSGAEIFTRPRDQRTEDYITGRFG